ncbi:MAG: hypothetical protein GWP14_06930 [Actinobacteria bacterium]|nr:hypothetical protein [Actinomycetota bacterium]
MSKFICGSSRPRSEWSPLAFTPLKDWPKRKKAQPTNSEKPLLMMAMNFGPEQTVDDREGPLVDPACL